MLLMMIITTITIIYINHIHYYVLLYGNHISISMMYSYSDLPDPGGALVVHHPGPRHALAGGPTAPLAPRGPREHLPGARGGLKGLGARSKLSQVLLEPLRPLHGPLQRHALLLGGPRLREKQRRRSRGTFRCCSMMFYYFLWPLQVVFVAFRASFRSFSFIFAMRLRHLGPRRKRRRRTWS